MNTYTDLLQTHLAQYARTRLGIDEEGTFNGRPYAHILPDRLKYFNFIEPFRSDLQTYLRENPQIALHRYFHHLNSSQAFAFNFFYPFLAKGGESKNALSASLGVNAAVTTWAFERIPDPKEQTNVDVAWEIEGGGTVFCEVKLSESEFGTAKPDKRHEEKLVEIYLPRLKGRISDSLLAKEQFFRNYQLLRNIYLMSGSPNNHLVVLLPKANESLSPQLNTVLSACHAETKSRIHVAYIEDTLKALLTNLNVTSDLRAHALNMITKYVPPEQNSN